MTRVLAFDDGLALLSESETAHVIRLATSWGMLADLCFSDLVLYLPLEADIDVYRSAPDSARFVMVNHVRPSTSQTIYHSDLIGEVRTAGQRPLVNEAFLAGRIADGEVDSAWLEGRIRVRCIPVRCDGRVLGVLAREAPLTIQRRLGELEETYVEIFDRFATMIASGSFPFSDEDEVLASTPRVGDGVLLVETDGVVRFASPNAVSAVVRAGAEGGIVGRDMHDVGAESAVRMAMRSGRPTVDELHADNGVTIAMRCLPLLDESGSSTGAVVLLRDISELVRRDLMLLSKDATIREIHHRVKNNLQTISSLLRLQGRRLTEPSAKAAIEESVRRIRSIALVHETLSRTAGDDVRFIDVVRPVVRMVEESLMSPEHPVRFEIHGDGGVVPSPTATSMAVVLCELLQNVVQHAFPADSSEGPEPSVVVRLETSGRTPRTLTVTVSDNGIGMGVVDAGDRLGMSIVTTLVNTELGGTIDHTSVDGDARSGGRPGTVVRIQVPVVAADGDLGQDARF